jgi:hypothetical protein
VRGSPSSRAGPRRYTDFVSRWHTRVIGFVLATVLAGMPAVALVCTLACSPVFAKNDDATVASANHSHHGATRNAGSATDTLVSAACQPDCCRDIALVSEFVTPHRPDSKLSSVPGLFVPTGCSALHRQGSALTDPRAAPPGRSFQIAQPLPLRI